MNATGSLSFSENSHRAQLYGRPGSMTVSDLQKLCLPNKAVVSEFGWIYLLNEASNFISLQLGEFNVTSEVLTSLQDTLKRRCAFLASRNMYYHQFVVPEKSVVYPEFLPKALIRPDCSPIRPAQLISALIPKTFSYLGPYLRDAKSLGQIFFKGDSHANWLGAWEIYNLIVRKLSSDGVLGLTELIPLGALDCWLAAWDGDISSQLGDEHEAAFKAIWGTTLGSNAIEAVVARRLPENCRRASKVVCPAYYNEWFKSRETLVYERSDRKGMKAVFFRDSTVDILAVDLLAQHFSRSVFVWHKGFVVEDVLQLEQPEVVIHIMAERFLIAHAGAPTTLQMGQDTF